MKKATAPGTTLLDKFFKAEGVFAPAPIVLPQITHLLEAQKDLFADVDAYSKHWLECRQTDTQLALETAAEVAANGMTDPAKAMTAIANWQQHAMGCLVEEVQAWTDLCSRCAGYLVSSEVEANKDIIEETAKKVLIKPEPKHAIPV